MNFLTFQNLGKVKIKKKYSLSLCADEFSTEVFFKVIFGRKVVS